MDREIVDVIDNAGTDAGWQRGIAVGWKVADIQADAGRADRALGERETANRCGRGCQATLPRIRSGGPTPIFWTLKYGLDRSERLCHAGGSLLDDVRAVAEGMRKISYAGYRFPPEVIHQ